MKKLIVMLGCVFMLHSPLSNAQNDVGKLLDNKMDQASTYLEKSRDIPKAWQLMVDISNIVKNHPEYDDGEYAEGMIDLTANLLTKPWKYAAPYLIGSKSTASFQDFIVNHINELSPSNDLKVIKKNISANCNQIKYRFCKKIIIKISALLV